MEFLDFNLRGNVLDMDNPNGAWFEPDSDPVRPNWAKADNDRWLFQTGSLQWKRVKPVSFTYTQYKVRAFAGLDVRDLTANFSKCGMEISINQKMYETFINAYVVPLNEGFLFVNHLGPNKETYIIYVTEEDKRLKEIKRMRNFVNELLMAGKQSKEIQQEEVLARSNFY